MRFAPLLLAGLAAASHVKVRREQQNLEVTTEYVDTTTTVTVTSTYGQAMGPFNADIGGGGPPINQENNINLNQNNVVDPTPSPPSSDSSSISTPPESTPEPEETTVQTQPTSTETQSQPQETHEDPPPDRSSGNAQTGELTVYDYPVGAYLKCGYTGFSSEDSEYFAIALPAAEWTDMGSNCGRSYIVEYNGVKINAKLGDGCAACAIGDVDLPTGLYKKLLGANAEWTRLNGVKWYPG